MSLEYKGRNGKVYSIIEPWIGKGGEGAIYHISGRHDLVAKIYFQGKGKNSNEKKEKILAMIDSGISPDTRKQVTWPIDILMQNNQFCGYVMPKLSKNQSLNEIYSDTSSSIKLDDKIALAMNLCVAINSVHRVGQVCGDLNPKNICINSNTGFLTLVDTDSYHITNHKTGKIYRCTVGLPEYLPVEVQMKMKNGSNLITAALPTYTTYSDYFALAVHIFALLMNGTHPFACALELKNTRNSEVAPQPVDNICKGVFPFMMGNNNIKIPIYSPPIKSLPNYIQKLFKRAFIDGHSNPKARPTPVEWYNALDKMKVRLKTCSDNYIHRYYDELKQCPWCEVNLNQQLVLLNITSLSKTPPTPMKATQSTSLQINNGASPSTSSNIATSTQAQTKKAVSAAAKANMSSFRRFWASESTFWIITLLICALAQWCSRIFLSTRICNFIRSIKGLDSFEVNIFVFLWPIGSIVIGFITCLTYNFLAKPNNYCYGWKEYGTSILIMAGVTLVACPILIILLVLLRFLIYIVSAILIIVFLCWAISNL